MTMKQVSKLAALTTGVFVAAAALGSTAQAGTGNAFTESNLNKPTEPAVKPGNCAFNFTAKTPKADTDKPKPTKPVCNLK